MVLPSLMCGVTLRMVPTSSRWMVSNGLVVPFTAAVELVYWPVMSGISCVTFTSASSLFMVITRGVEMMLLGPVAADRLDHRREALAGVGIVGADGERGAVRDHRGEARGRRGEPVVPVVVVALVVLLVSPLTPLRAAAAMSTMLEPLLPGKLVTP